MYIIPILTCVFLIAADQIVKHISVIFLKPVMSMTVLEGIFSLTYVENRGAAFGLMQGARVFFIISTIVISIGIIFYYIKFAGKNKNIWLKFSLILILSGAWGNFIDRLLNGFVVDMLEITFISWPVFNMADIYVVVGTIIFSVVILFFEKENAGANDGNI